MLLIPALRRDRGLAILRASRADHLQAAANTLLDAGFGIMEFPLTTPGALATIETVSRQLGTSALIGAGTVLTGEQARSAIDAGAQFLVTPAVCLDVLQVATAAGLPVISGCFSPTDVLTAQQAGTAAVKLFPAVTLGPEYARQLLGPFPDLEFVPTGGVDLAAAKPWLDCGAIALGLGAPLVGESLETGDMTKLARHAAEWRREVPKLREPAPTGG